MRKYDLKLLVRTTHSYSVAILPEQVVLIIYTIHVGFMIAFGHSE